MKKMMITLNFESQLAYLPIVRKVIREICSFTITNEQHLQDIELSIHEALSNVILHAYGSEAGHQVELIVSFSDKEILIQIKDNGLANSVPYSPLLLEYDIHNLDKLPESGRGLFFIHQLMDEVSYKTEEGKNTLLLRKQIN